MRAYGEWFPESLCQTNIKVKYDFLLNPRKAKKHCSGCPVRSDCFQYGLLYDEEGIWGGTTTAERRTIKTRNPQIKAHLEKEAKSLGILENRYSIESWFEEIRKSRQVIHTSRQPDKSQVQVSLGVVAQLPTREAIEVLWAELNIQ